MARPTGYIPSVKRIRWSFKHKNSLQYRHGNRSRNERRELEIRFFTSAKGGTAWGYGITLEVIYDYDPRNKLRAFVSMASLRSLPAFICDKLLRAGLPINNPKRWRVPLYRVCCALWGGQLSPETDCHHKNSDCLDDRGNNLSLLHKDEHALLHLQQGDLADAVPRGDMESGIPSNTGFFDYRELHKRLAARSNFFARTNYRRKEMNLPTISNVGQSSGFNKLFVMRQLHQQLCDRLLCN